MFKCISAIRTVEAPACQHMTATPRSNRAFVQSAHRPARVEDLREVVSFNVHVTSSVWILFRSKKAPARWGSRFFFTRVCISTPFPSLMYGLGLQSTNLGNNFSCFYGPAKSLPVGEPYAWLEADEFFLYLLLISTSSRCDLWLVMRSVHFLLVCGVRRSTHAPQKIFLFHVW